MSVLMVPSYDINEEQKNTCSLRELYDIFTNICKENSKNNPSNIIALELSRRTVRGYLEEDVYETGIKELGKTRISNFDIFFFDWLLLGNDVVHKDAINSVGISHSVDQNQLLKENSIYFYPDNSPREIVSLVNEYEEESKEKGNGFLGLAAFTGLDNGDPYIDNLRSSNIAPYGNQQVNITQPNPSTQNYGDEIVPYEFNFTRQRFTSPEEVLNHVMGSDQQNVNPVYQQPCYIDQWGNVIYYNPQSY